MAKSGDCAVCRHPDRIKIETAKLAGASLDAVAAKFECKRDALWRHMAKHVDEDRRALLVAGVPLRELADRAADEGVSLLDYFAIIRSTLMNQMIAAASVNDRHATAALAGKATDALKEIGKLTGEILRSAPVANVTNHNTVLFMASPAFATLERMLVERLAPHPAALQAVLEGLRSLEGSPGEPDDPPPPPTITLPATEVSHARAA